MKTILAVVSLVGLASTNSLTPKASTERRQFLQTTATFLGTVVAPSLPARAADVGGGIVYGKDNIMRQKAHGTSDSPVQSDLLYGVSNKLADQISNYNRQFAERAGYFQFTSFEDSILKASATETPITFYDSVTGKPLFVAPLGRSADEFLQESRIHGWPSFRDEEVVWDNVRVLKPSGETVSLTGTHLGHNLPDRKGNRYCINLVSIAGQPSQ
mmetsp:Transcript_14120/g.21558  ORF Transcript_14120/g.21558 Transcript_14120/m.21558 type:complete len:214 (+) Transcript_14120:186-827(+)|eukprot:CAMPEP_0178895836 /NCGR_PEP_ID=MMETSP0786-20121207/812_1 /TAXON_ID=186022 /ORGANISM="Thalassionema frauenfeldii, Strain CCMP 1798" /LENGTH=213 /DNA_ID=CAMNT_0020566119 /DNA_START=92 /DNA_END=733 /DNA_ORIENTATION=+